MSDNVDILEPIIEDLNPIMRAYPEWYHITYTAPATQKPCPLSAVLTPTPAVTELKVLFLATDASAEALEAGVARYLKEVEASEGFICAGSGWVLQNEVAQMKTKGKALNIAIGWRTAEAQSEFEKQGGSEKWEEFVGGLVSECKTDILELKRQ